MNCKTADYFCSVYQWGWRYAVNLWRKSLSIVMRTTFIQIGHIAYEFVTDIELTRESRCRVASAAAAAANAEYILSLSSHLLCDAFLSSAFSFLCYSADIPREYLQMLFLLSVAGYYCFLLLCSFYNKASHIMRHLSLHYRNDHCWLTELRSCLLSIWSFKFLNLISCNNYHMPYKWKTGWTFLS